MAKDIIFIPINFNIEVSLRIMPSLVMVLSKTKKEMSIMVILLMANTKEEENIPIKTRPIFMMGNGGMEKDMDKVKKRRRIVSMLEDSSEI